MENLKDYREKELRYYTMANILILLLLLGNFQFQADVSTINAFNIIINVLEMVFISGVIFVFTFLADSLFPSELKQKSISRRVPGETIFSKIKEKNTDKRFTWEQAKEIYKSVYNNLPENKKERYMYENSEWYKIYNKHRDNMMIKVSNRDFLLCRDIYFATIVTMILYLVLAFIFKVIIFDCRYIGYLICMLIISNVGTRNKAKRFVYNVISYDIT
ncbi:MAG: hypothetical protein LBJ41_10570, partial [Treponema sp.]|nr:hypothetical protein [Treponema sp.]